MGLLYCIWADYARKYFTGGVDSKSPGANETQDEEGNGLARRCRDLLVRATNKRPLYVVFVIYDGYRSQLHVIVLTLVFEAILLLVFFAPPCVC